VQIDGQAGDLKLGAHVDCRAVAAGRASRAASRLASLLGEAGRDSRRGLRLVHQTVMGLGCRCSRSLRSLVASWHPVSIAVA
jgi:hypothetical protein